MASEAPFTPSEGDVLLLVGTMKGAFVFSSGPDRREWRMQGPHFRGQAVYAIAFDQRGGRRRILASSQSMHWGSVVATSDDFGATWTNPEEANIKFPESAGTALKQIWQIMPGRDSEPDALYCGVEPAAVFESRDAGQTWTLNDGLWNHPHRPMWQPGGGGLCLHTILIDPLETNTRSHAFYERLGARPLKEWIINRVSGEALRALAAKG